MSGGAAARRSLGSTGSSSGEGVVARTAAPPPFHIFSFSVFIFFLYIYLCIYIYIHIETTENFPKGGGPSCWQPERTSFGARVLSALCRVNVETIYNAVRHARGGNGPSQRPVVRKRGSPGGPSGGDSGRPRLGGVQPDPQGSPRPGECADNRRNDGPAVGSELAVPRAPAVPEAFVNLVRICAFMAARGIPRHTYTHLVHIVAAANGQVGEAYHSKALPSIYEGVV